MVKNSLKRYRRIIKRIFAFTKREFKLRTRYKFSFISTTIFSPILHILPLIVIYWGLLTEPIGIVNSSNFYSWLFLGALCYQIFFLGSGFFRGRFMDEKYWMTIYGTLIAPISKYYLLFGTIIQLEIEGFISTIIMLTISFIFNSTALISFFLIFLITILTVIMGAALGLINGTIYLVNENYVVFLDYLGYAIAFFSTYSIPFEIFSKIQVCNFPIFEWVVRVNPLFNIINLVRFIWLGKYSPDLIYSLIYIIILTICLVIIAVYLFSKITRRYGVRGY